MRFARAISIREVRFALDLYRDMAPNARRSARRQSPDHAVRGSEESVSVAVLEPKKAVVSVRIRERRTVVPIRVRRERKKKHTEDVKLFVRSYIKPRPKYLGSEFIDPPSVARLMARR
jgi:hypothetical protein